MYIDIKIIFNMLFQSISYKILPGKQLHLDRNQLFQSFLEEHYHLEVIQVPEVPVEKKKEVVLRVPRELVMQALELAIKSGNTSIRVEVVEQSIWRHVFGGTKIKRQCNRDRQRTCPTHGLEAPLLGWFHIILYESSSGSRRNNLER